MIRFSVPGKPLGKGRPRFSRASGRVFTPAATMNYEGKVALFAREAMGDRAPFDGPISGEIGLCMPIPASWSKKKRARALSGEIRPTTKPDLSNVIKAIEDACNCIVFRDDSQIVRLSVDKFYGEAPNISVLFWEIEP